MDFSNSKFSFGGETPDFLPNRLRLPSGDTRYSYDISIEEVESCGYSGPYEVPFAEFNQIVEWDKDNLKYVVRPKTEFELKSYTDHLDALQYIELALLEESTFLEDFNLLTEKYIEFKLDYFKKLKELKASNNPLTIQLVKDCEINLLNSQPTRIYKTKQEFQEACNQYFTLERDRHKREYETYGLVPVDPLFKDYFTVDSSWVLGSDPYPWPLNGTFVDFRPGS